MAAAAGAEGPFVKVISMCSPILRSVRMDVSVIDLSVLCSPPISSAEGNEIPRLAFRENRVMLGCACMTCGDGGSDEAPAAKQRSAVVRL